MHSLPLGRTILMTLAAGLLAGLLVAAFHFVVTEPLIEQAIALEETSHGPAQEHEEPVVSRGVQRAGLFLGYMLYGLTWSLIFGVVFHASQGWQPAWTATRRALVLTLAAFWSAGLVPFLKYPASPPGVGEPNTIAYRQALYFGILALSVAGTVAAIAIGHYVRRSQKPGQFGLVVAVGIAVAVALVLYVVFPANPDPVRLPADLMFDFRVRSLAGIVLFWAAFGAAFAWLAGRAGRTAPQPVLTVDGAGR